jgi:hypothetical protein
MLFSTPETWLRQFELEAVSLYAEGVDPLAVAKTCSQKVHDLVGKGTTHFWDLKHICYMF